MNVVDSSGWLEYFTGGENAKFFVPAIEDTNNLIVPVICVYEVFKRIMVNQGVDMAEVRIADLHKGKIVDLTASLALSAAVISAELKLPMADSMILATARASNAILWTQDEHFQNLDDVKYIVKTK
ncbi:MAG TPA: type II toxin-antitoxin system VapC family toxin [Anaerolineales bacterium]|nr:type II toxin-antitoxin system VapC family toxin [Anaerolineales bacterium]